MQIKLPLQIIYVYDNLTLRKYFLFPLANHHWRCDLQRAAVA